MRQRERLAATGTAGPSAEDGVDEAIAAATAAMREAADAAERLLQRQRQISTALHHSVSF
jgi:hypothetical protein